MRQAWAAELIEVKPPVDYPVNMAVVYFLFGVCAILLFLFIRAMYKKFVQGHQKKEIPSPINVAYVKLEQLRLQKLPEKGELKTYYTLLSDILRRYFEDRFHIKAVEMTTPEFLEHMQRSHLLDKEQQALVRQFLDSSDMVKFAKYRPGTEEAEQSFQLAKEIIDWTKN